MGTFSANIAIGSPDGSRFETVNALVDTGASITAIPAPILHRLGVTPHDRDTFILADGRVIEREIGQAWLRVSDRSVITLVMFADEETPSLLGAYSLQGLRLAVDSPTERLIPSPRLRMGRYAVR